MVILNFSLILHMVLITLLFCCLVLICFKLLGEHPPKSPMGDNSYWINKYPSKDSVLPPPPANTEEIQRLKIIKNRNIKINEIIEP